jgi:ABC-2 type transport system ATP-binding protein
MQEVQAICDRVVVINKGRIVADDSIGNLLKSFSASKIIIVEFEKPVDKNELLSVKGVNSVKELSNSTYSIESDTNVDIRSELFRFSTEKQLSLIGLKIEEQSLESVFKELTRETNTESIS